jgi:hypothetical protein
MEIKKYRENKIEKIDSAIQYCMDKISSKIEIE